MPDEIDDLIDSVLDEEGVERKEPMKEVEVYYGYYLGDAQVWDSEHFRIPLEDDNERAIDRFQEEFEEFEHPIAFVGILGVNENPDEEDDL